MAINKVEANGETLIDLTSDTATANDVIEGKTLHLASGAVATGTYRPSDEIEARLRATVGHSSKNLLKIEADSQTINGVTFTVDKTAGTVTANGTASTYTVFGLISPSSFYQERGMILSGCTGGSRQTYWIDTWDGSVQIGNFSGDTGISTQSWTQVRIVIRRGVSVSNLVFKPMIRDGSISDDAFEPYQTPTDERFKDYLPLSGGTMTGELTMSGSAVAMKGTNIDLAGDNPTSLTWSNSEFNFRDKNKNRAGFINIARGTDGSTRLEIDAQCRKSDNSRDYYNGIAIIARRDGTKAYTVSDPAAFRAAIGAGTSSFSGSYNDLTNKPNNSITLLEVAEAQATSAASIPNPDCARYIITVLLGGSSATTFDVDADYIGKSWLDANCELSTSVNGDNLNFALAVTSGTFNTIKIVKIVGIPK